LAVGPHRVSARAGDGAAAPPGHVPHAQWLHADAADQCERGSELARPGHVAGAGWRPSHVRARARLSPPSRDKWRHGNGRPRGRLHGPALRLVFQISAHFSDPGAGSGSVRPLRVRFFAGFHLPRLKHVPLHATVPWEGRLHPRKEGIFP
jgi:hypothetical protein